MNKAEANKIIGEIYETTSKCLLKLDKIVKADNKAKRQFYIITNWIFLKMRLKISIIGKLLGFACKYSILSVKLDNAISVTYFISENGTIGTNFKYTTSKIKYTK